MHRCHALVALAFALGNPSTVAAASILANANLRMGSGSVNSVNAGTGNVEQPFYYSGTAWRKLTYSSNGLDMVVKIDKTAVALSVGSTGSIRYDSATHASVTQALGSSGATLTRQYTLSGSTFTTNYTVCAASTELKNVETWVGTRDDYIGGTDGPKKELGSFSSSGAFVVATAKSSGPSAPPVAPEIAV